MRTSAQNRRYNESARRKRVLKNQCALCPTSVKDSPWRVCDSCRAKQRGRYKPVGAVRLTKVFLPPAARIAIYQRYKEGKQTARQLAATLGKSLESVRSLLQRVKRALKSIDVQPIGPRVGPRWASKRVFARCKCGLLLPCWNCPSAANTATIRVAA